MICISSNHLSVDQQLEAVIEYLRTEQPTEHKRLIEEFPDLLDIEWSMSHFDNEKMGVDPEYQFWVMDWIESSTLVHWWEGEPVIFEDSDDEVEL